MSSSVRAIHLSVGIHASDPPVSQSAWTYWLSTPLSSLLALKQRTPARTREALRLPPGPQPLGPALLRQGGQAPAPQSVPDQERRAGPLPRRDRAPATGRTRAAPELTLAALVGL